MAKRVLLMYISNNSGHHRACLAIENALHMLDKETQTKCVNSFHYTNPILEKIINKTYMTVIRNRPEVWEYLYDNPLVVKKTQRLKEYIHRFNSTKMKALLDTFRPDAAVCTQAFPCGMIADLKKTYNLKIPLIAVLTDYAPHSYWVYDSVNAYICPSQETGEKLIENGISEEKVKTLGTPVDPKFYMKSDKTKISQKHSLDIYKPVILIMGGGQGLGPIKKLVLLLDKSTFDIQIIVVTGINKQLYNHLRKRGFRKNIRIFSFSEDIHEFMEIAALMITKPGGITIAEALSKNLPIIIVNPLPGQEAMNTRYLLQKRLAVKAKDEKEAMVLLEELLYNPAKIANIKKLMEEYARPDSAIKTARLILDMVQ